MGRPWQSRDERRQAHRQGIVPLAVLLGLLASLSACATPAARPAGKEARQPSATYGVIVSRRPIEAPADGAMRASILGALGSGLPASGVPAALSEFIIRQDNGQTVSVVQADTGDLKPGERVVLSLGPRTRLAPAE
jgi:outer membrane lipoprotein SlyB